MPKILPNRYVREMEILRGALDLSLGDQYFLPVENKGDQKRLSKSLHEARAKLERDDLRFANLSIHYTVRDGKMWVVITHNKQKDIYVKRANGQVERATIQIDPERDRLIRCMVVDKLPIEEMNSILTTPLTETEIREYITKGRLSK